MPLRHLIGGGVWLVGEWFIGQVATLLFFSSQCILDMTCRSRILVELEGNSDEQFTVDCEWVRVFPIQAIQAFGVQGLVWTKVWEDLEERRRKQKLSYSDRSCM